MCFKLFPDKTWCLRIMCLETMSPHFNLWPCFCLALGSWTSTWSPFLTYSWAIWKIFTAIGLPKRWNKLWFLLYIYQLCQTRKLYGELKRKCLKLRLFPFFAKNVLNLSFLRVLDNFLTPDFSLVDESLFKLRLTVNTDEHLHSSCVWTLVNDSS